MLQRVQTVYLVISASIMGALYIWFPTIISEKGLILISKDEPVILGLIFGSILIAFFSIFSYKKRKSQFVINRLNIILNFFFTGSFRVSITNVIRRNIGFREGYWSFSSYHFYRFFSHGQ